MSDIVKVEPAPTTVDVWLLLTAFGDGDGVIYPQAFKDEEEARQAVSRRGKDPDQSRRIVKVTISRDVFSRIVG